MVGLKEIKKELTMKTILEKSEILFDKNSFDKTRISQIAKEVGIAEGTIYNYFPSKFAILLSIVELKMDNREYFVYEGNLYKGQSKIIDKIIRYTNQYWGWVANVNREFARTVFSTVVSGIDISLLTSSAINLNREYIAEVHEILNLYSKEDSKLVRRQAIVLFSIVMSALQLYAMDKNYTMESIWKEIVEMIVYVMDGWSY